MVSISWPAIPMLMPLTTCHRTGWRSSPRTARILAGIVVAATLISSGRDRGSSDFDITHRFTLSVTYTVRERKARSQLLEGWQLNTIITLQSGQPWGVNDQANNFSGANENADRWNFFGNPADFKSIGPNGIPCFGPGGGGACTGPIPAACLSAATAVGPAAVTSLTDPKIGTNYCYMVRNSVLIPNGGGQFGNMGRNIFRDTGFHNMDLSISKSFKFGEKVKAQFRVETFNFINHPNFANPYGSTSGYGQGATGDPSQAGAFGCGCATPISDSLATWAATSSGIPASITWTSRSRNPSSLGRK